MIKKENKYNAVITGLGMYAPEKVLDNHTLEQMVDTNDEWIVARTGIKERRIYDQGPTSEMAIEAVKDLINTTGLDPKEIDAIIVATVTPDMLFPSTAAIVQEAIGATNAWGFDINAACSSFLFALQNARSMIEVGEYKKILVVGADKMSSITDYTDRNTCILFGDLAAAVLLEPTEDKSLGIQDSLLHIDGSGKNSLYMLGGGSLNPPTYETVDKKMHYIYQDGKTVFKFAVKGMADISVEIMEKNGLKSEDIAWLVPHQANKRIMDATAQRMGLPPEQVMINIHKYGNTTSATIPSCLTEYYRAGKVKKGDKLVLAAFGAGFTWGSMYLTWGID